MYASLMAASSGSYSILQIAIFILVLIVILAIVNAILRLTFKLFAIGCSVLLIIGLILIVLRALKVS
jgi:hypothetical protein